MRMLFLVLVLVAAGCSADNAPPFEVSNIEITEPMPGRNMSAGFMTLTNNTSTPILITEVRSPNYGSVQIHESTIEDGVARMRRIAMLEIPARSETVLARGGLHLMLMRANGDPDAVSLSFYNGETLVIDVVANVTRRTQ